MASRAILRLALRSTAAVALGSYAAPASCEGSAKADAGRAGEALEKRIAALEAAARRNSATAAWARDVLEPEPLFTAEVLQRIVASLAAQISRDYGPDDELVVVGLMDGAFIFLADLCRELSVPHNVDFICASSYGLGTVSSGNVKITKDASNSMAGKHVLIVDEMCDSGRTLASLRELLGQRNAKSVRTCVLLDKVSRRAVDVRPDYVGAVCPDEFVVGYGMDWGGKYRSLPFVGVVKRELYAFD
ncbi:phosphoribosyltransferase-like protein [Pelagophyceae sp. CCMP2097]|nr:phosphoribosyltransferase-like protein [Pelagophyceae sp. CCMP2097]|eukprot:CAMPEP_0184251094 /NCGR_PEP_ID=MMETSP0977-20130417/5051_1 /TAXON_ID=483370 /ORGANISM="non described non described, Strain CCMP2097" /LENGTH=245 /DNA_ID=CAMNT_0026556547 /DNA_START=35 /DNA_END=772 /DNA_ORIENTATION=-